jgi:hypothetical protein
VPHVNIRFADDLHEWADEQAKAERRPLGTWIRNLVEDFQSKKLVLLEDCLWPDVHFCLNLKGDYADAFDKRILRLAPLPIFVYGSFVLSGISALPAMSLGPFT